jgi:hypothetical protein
MGFFDIPAPPPDDEPLGPAEEYTDGRWLAGVLAVEQIIGRSDQAAVAVRRMSVLPGSFEIEVVAWLRRPPRRRPRRRFPQEILLSLDRPWVSRAEDGSLPPDLVRFGIQFPDGGRATNVDADWPRPDVDRPEHGLRTQGGSSSAGEASQRFSARPLPAVGDVVLVCEWPAYGIAESRLTIDGDALRAAAARAQPVWPDEPMPTEATAAVHQVFARRRAQLDELFGTAAAGPEPPGGPDADDSQGGSAGPASG